MKTLWKIAAILAAFVAGLYIGDHYGRSIGYDQGVIDHTDELVQSADSLRAVYQQRVDDMTALYDTIQATETTYTLIRAADGN